MTDVRPMLFVLAVTAVPALAQEHMHAPAAPGQERLGSVHMPTSCAPAVAPAFDRGVALLHSFEFGEAIRSFNTVIAADSSCAMGYWGLALSRWTNPMANFTRTRVQLQPGMQAIETGRRAATRATARERAYLDAVARLYEDADSVAQSTRVRAYANAMRELAAREAADTEATIFYAIALTAAASPTDKTYADQLEAGRILEPLWAKHPDHPGLAHYLIHTYDAPALAARGESAAQRYADIAPSAAHAQHMPSHIFTRVGEWQASIDANLASIAIAERNGAIGEALHASDYLVYAYLQLGRDADARALLARLPVLATKFDPNAVTGAAPAVAGVFALAAIPARYALERRAWREAALLTPIASSFPWCEAMTYFARALGAAHTHDLARTRESIDSLEAIRQRLAARGESYWSEQVAIQSLGAQAWFALARGDSTRALVLMRDAATREDGTEKSAVTPGPLAPARELLGDMLMELGRPGDALAEYRATLTKEPNRRLALEGVARAGAAR